MVSSNVVAERTNLDICLSSTPLTIIKPAFLKNDPLWIYKGDNSMHTYTIQTLRSEETGTIPLELGSDDLAYKTFNERSSLSR